MMSCLLHVCSVYITVKHLYNVIIFLQNTHKDMMYEVYFVHSLMYILHLSVLVVVLCGIWYYSAKSHEKYLIQLQIHFSLMIISYVYRSFIPNRTIFMKYCLTQWILNLPGSFDIHWARQYLVNFMGLTGRVNTDVYKTEPLFTGLGRGKLSRFLKLVL